MFAELDDRALETVREHEAEWLGDLHSRLGPAREKRHQAELLLAEAKADEYRVYKLGQWLQITADDQPSGRQPAPVVGPVPEHVSVDVLADSRRVRGTRRSRGAA